MVLSALAPLTHSRLTPLRTWVLFVSLQLWTLLWFSFLCTCERAGGWEHSRQGNTIMKRVPGFPGPRLFFPQGPASTSRAEHCSVQPRESQGDSGATVGMEVLFSIHRETHASPTQDFSLQYLMTSGESPLTEEGQGLRWPAQDSRPQRGTHKDTCI